MTDVDAVPPDAQASKDGPDGEAELLGQRVEYLLTYVQPLGRRYTLQEVVDGIKEAAGTNDPKLSVGRLWALAKGKVSNPTIGTLRVLGEFFGVPLAYFIDDEVAARVSAQLALVAAMRANDVRSVALRAAAVATMSTQGIEAVRSLVERGGVMGDGPAGEGSPAPRG